MGEEFSGLGSTIFLYHPDDEKIVELNLDTKTSKVIPKSDEQRHIDRIMATPPSEMIVPTDNGFEVIPTGFSASFTCELTDGAEAEALRDMMRRDMPDMEFDVQILPSLYKKCYGRAPRKTLKAMNHGGYYRRNTKWKHKAIALFNRYPEQSPFTICNAKMKIEENGEVLILGRGVSKTQVLKQRRSK